MKPNNEVLLLDYKTGKYEEKHKFQLENYKNVLEKMNFEVTSKVLVYIGEEIKLIQL
jgi:CRISPR/Cas system-associated exonuclease Cas4 (RecB family)